MLVKEKHVKIAVPVSVYHVLKWSKKRIKKTKKEKNKLTFACFVLSPGGNTGVGAMSLIFRK